MALKRFIHCRFIPKPRLAQIKALDSHQVLSNKFVDPCLAILSGEQLVFNQFSPKMKYKVTSGFA